MLEHKRYQIAILFVLVTVYSFFRKKADIIPTDPKKFLTVYLTRNVGDMIFTTPVFHALKIARPDAVLTVIGRPRNAETLAHNPSVDTYVKCPDSPYDLWKAIRRERPEYAFLFAPSFLELAVLFLAGVPAIGVFSMSNLASETRTFTYAKKLCIEIPFVSGRNFASENLKLLHPLGIEATDTRKHLYASSEAKKTIQVFLTEAGIKKGSNLVIALAPGAGTKAKQWPADRFAKLADHLYQTHGAPIFVVGGPGDTAEFELVKNSILPTTKIVSCLHHTIDELKGFGEVLDVMIANDSAPIYVAEAFGKATVTIVGPTNEHEHPPIGKLHKIVKGAAGATPALTGYIDPTDQNMLANAREQIESVTLAQVVNSVDALIQDLQAV
jgi:ADP-heptose:LPS heptosyltransferase